MAECKTIQKVKLVVLAILFRLNDSLLSPSCTHCFWGKYLFFLNLKSNSLICDSNNVKHWWKASHCLWRRTVSCSLLWDQVLLSLTTICPILCLPCGCITHKIALYRWPLKLILLSTKQGLTIPSIHSFLLLLFFFNLHLLCTYS